MPNRLSTLLVMAVACAWFGCAPAADPVCSDGTWDHDSNPKTACIAWSTCEPGTFVAGEGAASSDRVCAGCESGTFSSGANAAACAAWTVCAPGTFVARAGSAEADQTCEACPDGTLSQSANQSACTLAGECAAGTVQIEPATASTPAVCEACEAGTHCAGGTALEVACGDGTWDHDADPATACVAWTACLAGTFVEEAGTATSDRVCASCEGGTFASSANAERCEAWTVCLAGETMGAEGTSTTDRVCVACEAGFWDHDSDPATECVEWSDCEAGEYLSAEGSAATDRVCTACAHGSFSTSVNAPACGAWTVCEEGEFISTAGTATTDLECSECAGGTWDHDSDPATECVAWSVCEAGEYVSATGSASSDRVCVACDEGHSSTPNATSCFAVVTALDSEALSTCALLGDGRVKCWGYNGYGQLGLGDTASRGATWGQMGNALPAVDLGTGRIATAVAVGSNHACALLDGGQVKCWGSNSSGQLGLGDTSHRGDGPGEMGDALPAADLGTGRTARAIAAGSDHTCALLDDGSVKCWGSNQQGILGVGALDSRGDGPGEMGDALPAVDLGTGRTAKAIVAGGQHTCALLDDDRLKCWGSNGSGRLGLGDTSARGFQPSDMGDALPAVDLGTGRTAKALAVGHEHTCAVLDDGSLKCWGRNALGALGLGDSFDRGRAPGEMGDALPAVNLGTGRTATAVRIGQWRTCAVLDNGSVKCWGHNQNGYLGLGDTAHRGSMPAHMGDALPAVNLGTGRSARALGMGLSHACALLADGRVKCWGISSALGLGDSNTRGDWAGEMGDALQAVDLGSRP